MTFHPPRRATLGAVVAGGLAGLLLLAVALFPFGLLKGVVERRLSARFGRPVTIVSLDRVDAIGFSPTLAVTGLTIPQPAWAGQGDFVRLAEARARVSVWPLIFGHAVLRDVRLKGLRAALVRRGDGLTNWAGSGGGAGGIDPRTLAGLTIVDGEIVYRDALRHRRAVATVSIDPARGVAIDGRGVVAGVPVTLSARGPATADAGKPWPFTARLDGPDLAMTARGVADRPLDLGAASFAVTARASDLRLVDAVIEAGLFGTQPVDLRAQVRRDRPDWTITGLAGTIGGSDIAGDVTVRKRGGRNRIAGHLVSRRFAFEDLATTQGLAQAAALDARAGPKLVPDLPIDLARMPKTDGRIDFRVEHIVTRGPPSSLAAMRGTVTLDHQRLVVDPFTLDLSAGAITGRATVTQGGAPAPTLALDLTLAHSSITAVAGGHDIVTGSVTAHARLTGRGTTVRAAVGASDGRIGFVARDGILPARLAAALGFDAGRAFFASEDAEAGLRCVVIPLVVRGGHGTLDPAMIVDTSQSQLRGEGTVDFPSEALAIRLTGAPKHNSILRLPGSASVGGTIRAPDVVVAKGVKSFGNFLKAIGKAITFSQPPTATDADCDALAAAALR